MDNLQQGSNWRVLVIEDEEDNRDVIAAALKFYKMTVRTVTNGFEAIDVLKDIAPDFILCDLAMPKMDGWQTLLEIRSNPKTVHIPVIALTAYAMVGDREKALAKGFDGYITKPIDVLSLNGTLKTILAELAKKTAQSEESPPGNLSSTAGVDQVPVSSSHPGQNHKGSARPSSNSIAGR